MFAQLQLFRAYTLNIHAHTHAQTRCRNTLRSYIVADVRACSFTCSTVEHTYRQYCSGFPYRHSTSAFWFSRTVSWAGSTSTRCAWTTARLAREENTQSDWVKWIRISWKVFFVVVVVFVYVSSLVIVACRLVRGFGMQRKVFDGIKFKMVRHSVKR